MSFVARGGCCAHKDMNATKGGAAAMAAFWKANTHLMPPIKLFNKDNNGAVLLSDPLGKTSESEKRALSLTESGAIRLCTLSGKAFDRKDDKKGHQDSHAYYFAEKYGRYRRFPDTSSACFSLFIEAATELCTLHSAYIEYMEHIRKQKATRRLNLLESNIDLALNCLATLAELLCLSLYGQIISKPYIRLVRGATALGKGLADLVPLHTQVQPLLRAIITSPLLVLSLKSPSPSITLDGSEWENPGVLKALQDHGAKLPYLSDLFVVFCQGALNTWARCSDRFAPSGPITLLKSEQYENEFLPPTNDSNEGTLGTWRVWARRFPSPALHKFNAILINRANQTEAYIDQNFTLEQHNWIRAEARRIELSKPEQTRKSQIVAAQFEAAAKNQAMRLQRLDRPNKCEDYITGIQPILDPVAIQKMVGKELDDQLKFYKKIVVLPSGVAFPVIGKLKVAEKRALVIGLAEKSKQGTLSNEASSSAPKV
ncbi:hypothetical protein RhiXN_11321 [Rhizoctonia solani]|uniref:Uncharacterized protein n=1 Tax=Rhizoctonia solani TaxID=456999 RepID=A0A8H8P2P5_9AGAM|nr:uncharacterized protein RhiXN_11321 [Rhizoctonia solani]QRW24409.1 hypothetical protein RhiXN_11321 [Rhizoctonia solani]